MSYYSFMMLPTFHLLRILHKMMYLLGWVQFWETAERLEIVHCVEVGAKTRANGNMKMAYMALF